MIILCGTRQFLAVMIGFWMIEDHRFCVVLVMGLVDDLEYRLSNGCWNLTFTLKCLLEYFLPLTLFQESDAGGLEPQVMQLNMKRESQLT